jgi:tetratricopeptide (TPR) repeat protein
MSRLPFELAERLRLPLVENADLNMLSSGVDARGGLSALASILIVIPVVILLVVIVFIYKHTIGKSRRTTLMEDYKNEIEKCLKAGKFVSAAVIYEKQLKDNRKAAELYEKGGDYRQAARLYDLSGMSVKAKEMYQKEGDLESAAEVSILEGDYEDAAKLFHGAGNKIDAAMMLEKAGRKMAAVPVYREAGAYDKASQLLEEEGMLKEAAEMFGIPLRGRNVADCIDDFYTYALKLEQAGEQQKALEVFRSIDSVNHLYRDVKKKLEAFSQPSSEEVSGSNASLRSFIRSGKIDPRYALKLWIHMLKALQEAYKDGKVWGSLSPDTIAIDVHNNISFVPGHISSAYVSPEVMKGSAPDACSDIYSSGVILYELLMGNLDGLGSSRIIDSVEDVPEWLDEIVFRCIRKVREDRYQSVELIFSDIKALSGKKKPSERPEA